jgi:hypothetical protein
LLKAFENLAYSCFITKQEQANITSTIIKMLIIALIFACLMSLTTMAQNTVVASITLLPYDPTTLMTSVKSSSTDIKPNLSFEPVCKARYDSCMAVSFVS